MAPAAPACGRLWRLGNLLAPVGVHRALHEAVHLRDDGATHLHGVVLLGLGSEIGHMVGRIIDATDEAQRAVDHHDLAVHAPQHIEALAKNTLARIESAELHARLDQIADIALGQVRRAKTVDQHMHTYAPLRRAKQGGMQRTTDLVVEQDEGFQPHLAFGGLDGGEHAGKEVFSVFQQLEVVALHPAGGAGGAGAMGHAKTSMPCAGRRRPAAVIC